ncbi:NADP-dependent oxidoreductase [Pseudonocardia sp. CA-142604]|uniref:NADP-dependent oxidoreductase n=1 Tax=Pseudonocardia sp. CA-142604 TaxID=3240024 RepID=UPI003D8BBA62
MYESAPLPIPGNGEVLIAVHAAAITFDELTWPETWASGDTDRTPVIPSHEFSGVVAEIGHGVTGFSAGDEVYGLVPFDRDGAAAEYVSLPAGCVTGRPRTASHVVAAAAVLPALTAWEAVVEHAAVQPGHRVMVHGGAGGVGSFLTQLAAALGADVTCTVHTASDVGHVLALGADRAINTEQEPLDAETGAYDVVIDATGRDVPEALFAALRRNGRLITLQEPPSQEMADKHGVTALFFIVTPEQHRLTWIANMIDTGALKVSVAATFPLAEGRAAYKSGATRRRHRGKTVLIVRD